MDTILGLLGVVAFIVCVISIAAAVTWLVVRITPTGDSKKPKPETAA